MIARVRKRRFRESIAVKRAAAHPQPRIGKRIVYRASGTECGNTHLRFLDMSAVGATLGAPIA